MGEIMSKFKSNEEYFEFSKRLVVIPTSEIKELFVKYKIQVPLSVHRFLLKETIRDKVFEERLFETYTDEQKFRLRGYDQYSVFAYEKLISKYNLDFELSRYKELLFDFIFINLTALSLKNNFVKELEQLQHNYTVDLEKMKYEEFYLLFEELLVQEDGYLDGLDIAEYTDEVLTSYTLGDLKGLGKKYNVNIPRRINKSKLLEILSAKFKLTEDESLLLSKNSVLDLEIYAKEKGFKISIDLKKRDMIEFMKFALGMYHKPTFKDEFDYNIPLSTKEEEVVSDIAEEEPEVIEVIPEPEVIIPIEEEVEEFEPIPEPVVEPEPVPEPIVEETTEEELEEEQEEFEPIPEPITPVSQPEPVDESLLSNEEKELLDEKINQIIKKYYKKRRRKRVTWIIIIALIVLLIGFAGYSYLVYSDTGSLPFGIPVFW